jgi:hypothetical protein
LLALAAAAAVAGSAAADEHERFEAKTHMRGCDVRLATLEPRHDTLRLEVGCALTAKEASVALGAILGTAGAELRALLPLSLDFGRIVEHPWLAERLASSAWVSPDWDFRDGEPRDGEINRFTANLLRERRLLAEVEETFAKNGMTARVTSVEKVLVGPVDSVAELRPLTEKGVDPGARLPYDAILWLRIESGGETP